MRRFANKEEALEFVNTLPWGTAAGTTKDPRMAIRYAQAGAKIVHFGSITLKQRDGNFGNNFYFDERTGNSINAWGIPNAGYEAYLPTLIALKPQINKLGAKLWVSISAGDSFDAEEYWTMAMRLYGVSAADVVAANFSCPNIEVGGKRKPVVCYDLEAFREGVEAMYDAVDPKPFAVKIAPITEARLLDDIVQICLDKDVSYIEGANTMPNCYMEELPGKPAITMKRGGGAGRMLSPIINGMTTMIVPRLKGTGTEFIAVGGVLEGKDAYDRLALGAHGFEFNTALSARGGDPRAITEILDGKEVDGGYVPGLLELLVERGLPE